MTKTRIGRLGRLIAMLLTLIMVCSLPPITVFADNTTQNIPSDSFYTDTVTTPLDDNVSMTDYSYYVNADKPTNIRQSTSTTSATDFAAGLSLSTIFIDSSKIGGGNRDGMANPPGIFTLLTTDENIAGGFTLDGETVFDDEGVPVTKSGFEVCYDPTRSPALLQASPNAITELNGPLFQFVYPDAAILPDGTRADLRITYSNAKIAVDQRLGVTDEDLELEASNYQGAIILAYGSSFSYSGYDLRWIGTTKSNKKPKEAIDGGYTLAQREKMRDEVKAVNDFYSKYTTWTGDHSLPRSPVVGHTMDATYQIVDKSGNPLNGTFIFAMEGINLERDPYRNTYNNYCKPLWYYDNLNLDPVLDDDGNPVDADEDGEPDYEIYGKNFNFFNESIAIKNGMVSDYVYVRPNTDLQEDNKTTNPMMSGDRAHFYPQIILDENGNIKFIANAYGDPEDTVPRIEGGGNNSVYSSGFVLMGDAFAGITITATGHGGGGGTMDTQLFSAKQIWYRYIHSTGPHGNIQTTSEGNYGGTLNDTNDSGKTANKLDPGAYVVPEGKTVTYTMTPDPEYHISKLQVRNEDGDMQEIRFDGKPLYTMEEGNTVQFRDAAGQLCTLTALADGKFKLEMPYALHDEEVHVQWERTIATVTVKKETEDDKSGSFPFEIKAWKDEEATIYTPEKAGSIWYQDGDFWLEFGNGEAIPATEELAAIVSDIRLTDRIEISGGKYLWKTDKKLSDLGLSASGEDGDLYVDFLNAPSAVIGDTLDNALNTKHERISFYRLNSTTEEVTTYWNFDEGEGQTTDPEWYGFSLANGKEKTFDIPQKYEYKVYEETPAGWVLVSIDGTEDADSATGLLTEENYVPKHTFLNRKLPCGDLIVTKALAGNDTDSNKTFSFTITLSDTSINGEYSGVTFANGIATITLKGGESKVIKGLPSGTGYVVTEADYSSEGYVTTYTGDTGTIDEKTPAVASFTNTRDTYGDLVVTKTVKGNAPGADEKFSFTVTLSDTTINGTRGDMTFTNGVATLTLRDGESKKATGLPNGIPYEVTEKSYANDGYVTTKTGEKGSIVGNGEQTAAFTNTRNANGSLTVSKTLVGNDIDSSKEFTFTITLDPAINGEYSGVTFTDGVATIILRGGESKIIEGLPNGTGYEVVEEPDYSADGYELIDSTGASGTIAENAPMVAAFTNTRSTYGKLVVTKTVDGNAASTTKEFSFTVTISVKTINGT